MVVLLSKQNIFSYRLLSPIGFDMFPAAINSGPLKNSSYSEQQLPLSQFTVIDDSLTDIRWLGSMDTQFPSLDHATEQHYKMMTRPGGGAATKGRKKLSYGKKQDDGKSESDNFRPPFSYAALIALAINSHSQNMLTLNSIYRWIEDNFPFFRTPEARAWKVSLK